MRVLVIHKDTYRKIRRYSVYPIIEGPVVPSAKGETISNLIWPLFRYWQNVRRFQFVKFALSEGFPAHRALVSISR